LLRALTLIREGLAGRLKMASQTGIALLRKLQPVHQRGNGGNFRAFVM
jgi:hypothetical protein